MSIKIMQRVWEHSQHKGNNLLTLLALADIANDFGHCWPGISGFLADQTRLTPRAVGKRVEALAQSCELAVYPNPGSSHDYIVTIAMPRAEFRQAVLAIAKKRGISTRELALLRRSFVEGAKNVRTPEGAKNVRMGSEAGFGGDPKQGSDDPSLPITDPSSEEDEDETNIFDLYHHICGRMVASPYQQEELQGIETDFPMDWIADAFKIAVNAGARNPIKYSRKCLEDWKVNGHPDKRGGKPKTSSDGIYANGNIPDWVER